MAYIDFHKRGGPYLLEKLLSGGWGREGGDGVVCGRVSYWSQMRVVWSDTLNEGALAIFETSTFLWSHAGFS